LTVLQKGNMKHPTSDVDEGVALDELTAIATQMLQLARDAGASQAEVAVDTDVGLQVTVRNGAVETVEHHRDRGIGISVYFGKRKASASSSDIQAESLQKTVTQACEMARHTQPDPCHGLADAARMAQVFPDLKLDHPWNPNPGQAIDIALECETAGRDFDSRIRNSDGASVSTSRSGSVYANSHGFVGVRSSTSHSLSCVLIVGEGEAMQRDYHYSAARDFDDLQSASAVGREAGRRTTARIGARGIDSTRAPILFNPETSRGLIGHLIAAAGGRAQYREASFLLGKAGQAVAAERVSLSECPFLPGAWGSTAFDSEGVATSERDLVANGVLSGYVLSQYSAARLGLKTTGNAGGVHNLQVHDTGEDFTDLLRKMDRGLLVTSLMGQGVNLVNGDYSRGAAGFWVENGAIAFPVQEVTIAGNLADMFKHIVALGRDLDDRGNIRSGSILIEEMTIAGC